MIGFAALLRSRTEEAIGWLEKARSASPARPFIHGHLAAAYGLKGASERAAAALAEARRLSGDPERYSSIAQMRAQWHPIAPEVLALHETIYFAGLRLAGMPEE